MSGELDFTRRMNAATSGNECAVAVGLFGLQRKTIPAPLAATAIPSRSSFRFGRSGTARTLPPMVWAVRFGLPYEGEPLTSGRLGETKARTEASRMCPEPVVVRIFSAARPCPTRRAIASGSATRTTSRPYRPTRPSITSRIASSAASPGPRAFSFELIRMTSCCGAAWRAASSGSGPHARASCPRPTTHAVDSAPAPPTPRERTNARRDSAMGSPCFNTGQVGRHRPIG